MRIENWEIWQHDISVECGSMMARKDDIWNACSVCEGRCVWKHSLGSMSVNKQSRPSFFLISVCQKRSMSSLLSAGNFKKFTCESRTAHASCRNTMLYMWDVWLSIFCTSTHSTHALHFHYPCDWTMDRMNLKSRYPLAISPHFGSSCYQVERCPLLSFPLVPYSLSWQLCLLPCYGNMIRFSTFHLHSSPCIGSELQSLYLELSECSK